MTINYGLKNYVDKAFEAVDAVGKLMFELTGRDGTSLKDGARSELALYLMYLAASDGIINWDESRFISTYLGFNKTPAEINAYIQEHNIYSTEYESTPPNVMALLVLMDNILIDNHIDLNMDQKISEIYLDLYKNLGKEFLAADNDVAENEKKDLTIYIQMLERYLDENLHSRKAGVIGPSKKTGNSSSTGIGGVLAPKKN